MIGAMPQLISTLGFPIVVSCILLWEWHQAANSAREEKKAAQEERTQVLNGLKDVIKVDLVGIINELKMEIVKLNERCNGGKK